MSRWMRIAVLLIVALAASHWWSGHQSPDVTGSSTATGGIPAESTPDVRSAAAADGVDLPAEALATLQAIRRGGPFSYDRDGIAFQNRERRLPERPRGYYREYTVSTPGAANRGARRIVTGGDPPEVYYYTDDHYQSFRRIEPP